MTRRAWLFALASVAAGALALRAGYLLQIHGTVPTQVVLGDARQYDAWAQQIAAGQWLGSEIFYQAPLYPYLLAVLFKLAGHHLFLARICQAVLGASSCALLAVAGRRFFSPAAGLAAGALLAVYPPAIFFDGLIQKASLEVFLTTLVLALLGEFLERRRWPWIAGAGIALAALMLSRENARVIYPVVAAWLLLAFPNDSIKRRAAWLGIFTLAIAVTTIPVGLRNYVVGGEFLLSTSQLGPNLYIGNHAGASGVSEPMVPGRADAAYEREDSTRLAEAATGRRLSPAEVSSYWTRRTIAEVRGNPAGWARLMGRKLILALNASEIADTESLEFYTDYSAVLAALSWLTFGVILPLAAFGAWATRAQWRQVSLLHGMFAALLASITIFFVFSRYRISLVPLVLLFAGAGAIALPSVWRNMRLAVPGAIVAAVAAAIANLPGKAAYDTSYFNVGSELARMGRPGDAVPLLRKALVVSPGDPRQQYDLGHALSQTGDVSGAMDAYLAAIQAAPDYVEPHEELGKLLLARGKPEDAIVQLRDAVRLRPRTAQVHCNLGVALAAAAQWPEAIREYRESIRLDATDPAAHNDLGRALQHEGQTEAAVREFEQALSLRPRYAEAHSNLAVALHEKGDLAAAETHFAEALKLEPDNFGIHANYADLLVAMGRAPDAIAEYQRAIRLAPESVELQYRLAQVFGRAARWPEALATLRGAASLAQAQGDAGRARQISEAARVLEAQLKAR